MINKDELRIAYEAGYEFARVVEYGDKIYQDDKGFDEWYEREIANPPEGWDDHRDY